MEGIPHIDQLIGGTPEEKEKACEELHELSSGCKNERVLEYELKKGPEDLETIAIVESAVDDMVAQYGGKLKPIPLENIHILKPGGVLKVTGGRVMAGNASPLGFYIFVEKGDSKILFASTLAHEMFHLKSFKSVRLGESEGDVLLHRSGLNLIDKKDPSAKFGEEKEYFGMLEEAIVTECTKKVLDKISQEEIFREEVEVVERFRKWVLAYFKRKGLPEGKIDELDEEFKYIDNPKEQVRQVLASSDDENMRQAYAAGMFGSLYEQGRVTVTERYRERKKLHNLLDKLAEVSDGKFKSREEVFDVFARANFSGNYLPLARIVESILGKGSFRKIAEEFSEKPVRRDGAE